MNKPTCWAEFKEQLLTEFSGRNDLESLVFCLPFDWWGDAVGDPQFDRETVPQMLINGFHGYLFGHSIRFAPSLPFCAILREDSGCWDRLPEVWKE